MKTEHPAFGLGVFVKKTFVLVKKIISPKTVDKGEKGW